MHVHCTFKVKPNHCPSSLNSLEFLQSINDVICKIFVKYDVGCVREELMNVNMSKCKK